MPLGEIAILEMLEKFCIRIYPNLKKDLYNAGMHENTMKFVRLTVLISLIADFIFTFPITWLFTLFGSGVFVIIPVFILLYPLLFFIILHVPYFNVAQVGQEMDAEVAVVGRRLLIQLESGKSLVNALIDIGTKQTRKGNPLSKVAYNLFMGRPLEETINEAIDNSNSDSFKKLFVQIKNSLRTGTDLKHSLKITLEDITREKIVEFEAFGKKLNTMGLFYMIFGTIMPSLGAVIFVLFLASIGIKLGLVQLSFYLLLILPIQIFFIILFNKMRPELEI